MVIAKSLLSLSYTNLPNADVLLYDIFKLHLLISPLVKWEESLSWKLSTKLGDGGRTVFQKLKFYLWQSMSIIFHEVMYSLHPFLRKCLQIPKTKKWLPVILFGKSCIQFKKWVTFNSNIFISAFIQDNHHTLVWSQSVSWVLPISSHRILKGHTQR